MDQNYFLGDWFLLVGVMLAALASPGPDFVVAVRQSVLYGRRVGIYTAIGFAFGIAVHVSYCLFGIATLISQSILLFNVFKYVGAAYLFYMGICALRSRGMNGDIVRESSVPVSVPSVFMCLRTGFITNVLNPKATLFFLALFTQILHPDMPREFAVLCGATCVVLTGLWFSGVAVFLTVPAIRQWFVRVSRWADRLCGAALIALGIKLALAKVSS